MTLMSASFGSVASPNDAPTSSAELLDGPDAIASLAKTVLPQGPSTPGAVASFGSANMGTLLELHAPDATPPKRSQVKRETRAKLVIADKIAPFGPYRQASKACASGRYLARNSELSGTDLGAPAGTWAGFNIVREP